MPPIIYDDIDTRFGEFHEITATIQPDGSTEYELRYEQPVSADTLVSLAAKPLGHFATAATTGDVVAGLRMASYPHNHLMRLSDKSDRPISVAHQQAIAGDAAFLARAVATSLEPAVTVSVTAPTRYMQFMTELWADDQLQNMKLADFVKVAADCGVELDEEAVSFKFDVELLLRMLPPAQMRKMIKHLADMSFRPVDVIDSNGRDQTVYVPNGRVIKAANGYRIRSVRMTDGLEVPEYNERIHGFNYTIEHIPRTLHAVLKWCREANGQRYLMFDGSGATMDAEQQVLHFRSTLLGALLLANTEECLVDYTYEMHRMLLTAEGNYDPKQLPAKYAGSLPLLLNLDQQQLLRTPYIKSAEAIADAHR